MDIYQSLLKELKLYLMVQTEKNDAEAQYFWSARQAFRTVPP